MKENLVNYGNELLKRFGVDMGDDIFDYEIIHSIVNVDNFYKTYREDILYFKKYLFENRSLRYFIQVVDEYYLEFNDTPSFSEVYTSIERDYVEIDEKGNKIYSTWAKVLIDDLELIKKNIPKNDIFNENILKEKIMDRYKNWISHHPNHPDMNKVIERLAFLQTHKVGSVQLKLYDASQVNENDERITIPTGISLIDEHGGIARGEIGIIMAPTGIGKTTCLMVVGGNMAIKGKKVLQIVFEGAPNRYMTLMNRKILADKVNVENNPVNDRWKLIKLEEGLSSTTDIFNAVELYEKECGELDVLVVDYLDCIKPDRTGYKTFWEAESDVVNELERYCTNKNIVMWTAVQTNRSGLSVDESDLNQVAGSKKKLDKACMVIALNRTAEQKRGNMATMSILKNRYGLTAQAKNFTYNPNEMIIDTDDELLLG